MPAPTFGSTAVHSPALCGRIVLEASHDRTEHRAAAGDGPGHTRADRRSRDAGCLCPVPGRRLRAPGRSPAATRGTAPSGDSADGSPFGTGVLAGSARIAEEPTESW